VFKQRDTSDESCTFLGDSGERFGPGAGRLTCLDSIVYCRMLDGLVRSQRTV